MKKAVGLLLACLAGLWGATIPATAAVMDSVNADLSPYPSAWWGGQDEVGWLYRPAVSYDLTGLQTRFGALGQTPDPQSWQPTTVTAEVYDAAPPEGHLLRSADFTASTDLAGADFPALPLVAGKDYFIAFGNVDGLGVNYTRDPGATLLGPIQVWLRSYNFTADFTPEVYNTPDMYKGRIFVGSAIDTSSQPILRFLGEPIEAPSSAPEPPGVLLLGIGLLPILRRSCDRGRPKAV